MFPAKNYMQFQRSLLGFKFYVSFYVPKILKQICEFAARLVKDN